jgi:hypothetical protein
MCSHSRRSGTRGYALNRILEAKVTKTSNCTPGRTRRICRRPRRGTQLVKRGPRIWNPGMVAQR